MITHGLGAQVTAAHQDECSRGVPVICGVRLVDVQVLDEVSRVVREPLPEPVGGDSASPVTVRGCTLLLTCGDPWPVASRRGLRCHHS
jgi:hypothetical protein